MASDFLPGCGCLPRTTRPGDVASGPVFADEWLIDQGRWEALIAKGSGDVSYGFRWMLNQNPYGWCWTYSSAQAVMVCMRLLGQPDELLLPDAAPISMGIGDSGYDIGGVLREYVLPIGYPPIGAILSGSVDPTAYGKKLTTLKQLASNWKDMAACRRGLASFDCPTTQHVASALLHGWPCVAGIDWEDNPRGGHALCVTTLSQRGGSWYLDGPNSWGGLNGWCDHPSKPGWFSIPLEKWDLAKYGAWALCDAAWSPEDKPVPEAA